MLAASVGVCMLAGALLLSPSETAEANRISVGPADASTRLYPMLDGRMSAPREVALTVPQALMSASPMLASNYSVDSVLHHRRSASEDDFIDTVPGPEAILSPVDILETPESQAEPIVANAAEWRSFKVQSGDSMSRIFDRAGVDGKTLKRLLDNVSNKEWTRLYPGEELDFAFDADNNFVALQLRRSKLETWLIKEDVHERFALEKIVVEPDSMVTYAEGKIKTSLFLDGKAAGLSDKLIMELANLFGWDVDFVLDIRKGDSFRVMYEKQFLDGKHIADGPILAAEFVNQGKSYAAVRYKSATGQVDYYTPEGASVKKAFLRSPVDFARISSPFNLQRRHPILHKIRAHNGTDYAAARGTPIKATGDGRVVVLEKQRGYGNVVVVQHGSGITTLYAHMNNFRKGIRIGSKVRQGDVIGYVGSTGLATGPHLHFEFRVNGAPKNPVTVALPVARPVPKKERPQFANIATTLVSQLNREANAHQLVMNNGKDSQSDL